MLCTRVDAATREAAAEDAVPGSDAIAGRLGVVGAAFAGALLGRDHGDGADGEEAAEEEGEGCGCETHLDLILMGR